MHQLNKHFKHIFIFFVFFLGSVVSSSGQLKPFERICGDWENTDKSLIIQIYIQQGEFKAKILWYKDTEGKPLDYWTDRHNPDPALRSRKILGMQILRGLKYRAKSNSWENGMVYDSRHGREWNASAYIDKKGRLRVRGYWHFKFIGRTMTFVRVTKEYVENKLRASN
ncbi:MAG TPA: DUF2147 domain-containing protein [Mucilaginibacter sp.]|nr:DUF2147 domain-containing protein [Mucilaginibacter sp.]